jgi:hypothetical protein
VTNQIVITTVRPQANTPIPKAESIALHYVEEDYDSSLESSRVVTAIAD